MELSANIVTVAAFVLSAAVNTSLGPLPLNVADTPEGPEYVNDRVWENPFKEVTYMSSVVDEPWGMVTLVLERDREKSPVATWAATPCRDSEASVANRTMASMEGSRR